MADRALRVASVGLGWVTTNRHIPAIRRSRNARLTGLIDYQPDRAERLAGKIGVPHWAGAEHAAGVEWLDQVDAVTIGSPPRTHYALATEYLKAGKHVLVEKPMAMTREEARELSELARREGLVLGVVHNFQFTQSVKRVRRLLENGQIGPISSIWAAQLSNPRRRLPAWYEDLPLGLFYDESPHFFYLLRLLAGGDLRFNSINVVPSPSGSHTPAKINALLDANGLPVQVDMNFASPLSEWHIAVLGEHRAAIIDVFRDILITVPNDGVHLGRDILRTTASATWGHLFGTLQSGIRLALGRLSYGNDEVIERFCAACNGRADALAGISASDGVAVVELQHRVIEAAG